MIKIILLGAEAEDEALYHLYYRQSMKGPSKVELNKALGKLLNTLTALKGKVNTYMKQNLLMNIWKEPCVLIMRAK